MNKVEEFTFQASLKERMEYVAMKKNKRIYLVRNVTTWIPYLSKESRILANGIHRELGSSKL